MLVGNKSNIEVNPNLYIDEYDVMGTRCHIGSMSKEELFYLMSETMKERAEHLAVVSLVNPIDSNYFLRTL